MPVGNSLQNLAFAAASEADESTQMYPTMAKTARDEGFDDGADRFQTLDRAEGAHATRYNKSLEVLKG